MVQKSNRDLLEDLLAEFSSENDRSAVVVGAAQLDELLKEILQKRLLPSLNSGDELFNYSNALGNFSSRIHLAYRIGLISLELFRALTIVRNLRNDFAHKLSDQSRSLTLHADRVRELAKPFKQYKEYARINLAKKKFTVESKDFRIVVALLTACLIRQRDKTTMLDGQSAAPLIPWRWKRVKTT